MISGARPPRSEAAKSVWPGPLRAISWSRSPAIVGMIQPIRRKASRESGIALGKLREPTTCCSKPPSLDQRARLLVCSMSVAPLIRPSRRPSVDVSVSTTAR